MIDNKSIQSAIDNDPSKRLIGEDGLEVSESMNIRCTAYTEAHEGKPISTGYEYFNPDALIGKAKALASKAMGFDFNGYIDHYMKIAHDKGLTGNCMVCGTHIMHHYFLEFPDGKSGAVGCNCAEVLLDVDLSTVQAASEKAMRDTVERRKMRTVTATIDDWYNSLSDHDKTAKRTGILSYKVNCPYPFEKGYLDELRRWKSDYMVNPSFRYNSYYNTEPDYIMGKDEYDQIVDFAKKHSKCSEFMSSTVTYPTDKRVLAVSKYGCRTCRKKFHYKPREFQKPDRYISFRCQRTLQESYQKKGEAYTNQGVDPECNNCMNCVVPNTYTTSPQEVQQKVHNARKWKARKGNILFLLDVLKRSGMEVPEFKRVKADPLNDEELEALQIKVNKEIERAMKLVNKFKEDL